jgi:hypothetical protein
MKSSIHRAYTQVLFGLLLIFAAATTAGAARMFTGPDRCSLKVIIGSGGFAGTCSGDCNGTGGDCQALVISIGGTSSVSCYCGSLQNPNTPCWGTLVTTEQGSIIQCETNNCANNCERNTNLSTTEFRSACVCPS